MRGDPEPPGGQAPVHWLGTGIRLTALSIGMGDVEVSLGEDQSKARHYRRRAEEIFAVAQAMTDPAQRALLFQIAADYHKLAVALEAPNQEHVPED